MRENQKGFTLVELMVSMAILAIISGAIVAFLQVGSNFYQNVTCDVDLQVEGQQAVNQIENLLIDSTKGVSYQAASNELCIYEDTTRHSVRWDLTEGKLFYSKAAYTKDADGSFHFQAASPEDALMAEYVSDFSVSFDSTGITRSMVITLDLKKGIKSSHVSRTVTLRNAISVNQSESEMYDDTKLPTVSSVAIWYNGAEVATGTVEFNVTEKKTKKFSAVVKGNNNPSIDVIWTLEGNSSDATGLEISGGGVVIRVDDNEQSDTLILTAVSKQDSNRSAQVAIQLVRKEITGISITGPDRVYSNTEFTIEIAVTGNAELAIPDDVVLLQKTVSGATVVSGPTWDPANKVYVCTLKPINGKTSVKITYGAEGTNITDTYEKSVGYKKYTVEIKETGSSTALPTIPENEIWRNQSKTFEVVLKDQSGHPVTLDDSAVHWSCDAYNDASCSKASENSSVLSETSSDGSRCTAKVGVYYDDGNEHTKFVYNADYTVRISVVVDLPADADRASLDNQIVRTVPKVSASGLSNASLREGDSKYIEYKIKGIVIESKLKCSWKLFEGENKNNAVTFSGEKLSSNDQSFTVSLNYVWSGWPNQSSGFSSGSWNLYIDGQATPVKFKITKK